MRVREPIACLATWLSGRRELEAVKKNKTGRGVLVLDEALLPLLMGMCICMNVYY